MRIADSGLSETSNPKIYQRKSQWLNVETLKKKKLKETKPMPVSSARKLLVSLGILASVVVRSGKKPRRKITISRLGVQDFFLGITTEKSG